MYSSIKTFKSSLLISLLFLLVVSCSKPKSKLAAYGPVFENVMKSEMGVFRTINLGDKMDSVLAKEKSKPTETDSSYLYYEYSLDSLGSYNITYNFDEKGLSEIQVSIFINDQQKADNVFEKFSDYFNEHYGESQNHQGYTVWTVKSALYGIVRINLNDESDDYTVAKAPGKISLWIYPD